MAFLVLRLMVPFLALAALVFDAMGAMGPPRFAPPFGMTQAAYVSALMCLLIFWQACFAPSLVFQLGARQGRRAEIISQAFVPTARPRVFRASSSSLLLMTAIGLLALLVPPVFSMIDQEATLKPEHRYLWLTMALVCFMETARTFFASVTLMRDRVIVTGRGRREIRYRDIRNIEIVRAKRSRFGVLTLNDDSRVEVCGRLQGFDEAMGLLHGIVFPASVALDGSEAEPINP